MNLLENENITDEEIRYNFLLGNVSLISSDTLIKMEWEWIPLLDIAFSLNEVAINLRAKYISKECFEFTENAETLEFSKESEQLKISASFSPLVILTTVKDFEIATNKFNLSISNFISENILSKKPPPKILQKYLSIEIKKSSLTILKKYKADKKLEKKKGSIKELMEILKGVE
jgi:hypothetical protein